MAQHKGFFSKFQFEYRRSRPAVKLVAIVAVVFSLLAVLAMTWARVNVERRTEELRQEAARLEHENEDLQERLDILGSLESVVQIAMEELGLVKPDTVLIDLE